MPQMQQALQKLRKQRRRRRVRIGKSTFVLQKSVSAMNLDLIQAKKRPSTTWDWWRACWYFIEHVHEEVKHNQTKLRSLVHNRTQLALFIYTDYSSYQGV